MDINGARSGKLHLCGQTEFGEKGAETMKLCGILAAVGALGLSGCATQISYSELDANGQVPSGGMAYQLEDSLVTLNGLAPQTSGGDKNSQTSQPTTCQAATWSDCFTNVKATVTPSPVISKADAQKRSGWLDPYPDKDALNIWAVKPDDDWSLFFTTTTLTGTPATNQDYLYSSIKVGYKNNASTILTGAGTGAVTGLAMGGPWGALIGGVVGGVTAAPITYGTEADKAASLASGYVCPGASVNFAALAAKGDSLKPSLNLPVSINAADARPYSTGKNEPYKEPKADPNTVPEPLGRADCWHELPNTKYLGTVVAQPVGKEVGGSSPRDPVDGDGWYYRIVVGDDNGQPAGGVATTDYFKATMPRSDFPISYCRDATLQITWWQELVPPAGKTDPTPRAVPFGTLRVADPAYVTVADVSHGGGLTFKTNCGATVAPDVDTSVAPLLNAMMTEALAIYNAQAGAAATSTAKAASGGK